MDKRWWVIHSARAAIGAGLALGIATLCRLPEPFWAPITAVVVTEATPGSAWSVSWKRFVGTAMGAVAGAVLVKYLGGEIVCLAVGIFALGLICGALRLDRTAFRFAGITLFIVAGYRVQGDLWMIALTRFLTVSVGIAVGLAIATIWPKGTE
jgi:uncharacterized membrane protein YgaE (UPF0421/DUF939 family)